MDETGESGSDDLGEEPAESSSGKNDEGSLSEKRKF